MKFCSNFITKSTSTLNEYKPFLRIILMKLYYKPTIEIMNDYIRKKIKQIFEMQLFTLPNFKFVIDNISNILKENNGEDIYNQLIGLGNERRLMALYVLYFLGEHKMDYDNSLDFNSNLKNIFNVEDKIELGKAVYDVLQDLYKNNCFLDVVRVGIDIFNAAFRRECM